MASNETPLSATVPGSATRRSGSASPAIWIVSRVGANRWREEPAVAKTLDELLRERPGNPVTQARHRRRMLATVRRHQMAELRAIWPKSSIEIDVGQER